MNKRELARILARKTIFSQQESVLAIEAIFEEIADAISREEEVNIVGFGKFFPYKHSPRPVRNPKTQEQMILDSYTTLRFKSSSVLKDRLKKASLEEE